MRPRELSERSGGDERDDRLPTMFSYPDAVLNVHVSRLGGHAFTVAAVPDMRGRGSPTRTVSSDTRRSHHVPGTGTDFVG